MKHIIICFGGVSPEHEVSVITGLQVFERIDRAAFIPHALYVSQKGEFFLLSGLTSRENFLTTKKAPIQFGVDEKGGYLKSIGVFSQKIYPECAFMAFHGGNGESGPMQGFFESLGIAYTSASVEASAISMNKALSKEVVSAYGVSVIPGITIRTRDSQDKVPVALKLPLIVKPAHLGSSIGVTVAKSSAALKKAILAAKQVDSEIVVEKLMENYVEYNCAVRRHNDVIEASEVERPLKKDEILSFADKYERGGGKKSGGMASLSRELPAKIPNALKKQIQETAIKIFECIRADGMIRCDFLYTQKKLYLIEVNPIPGSMAFYLWEATGVSFTDQITDLIEEGIKVAKKRSSQRLVYSSNIIKNFISNTDQ